VIDREGEGDGDGTGERQRVMEGARGTRSRVEERVLASLSRAVHRKKEMSDA